MYNIGVDLGGTKIAVGLVNSENRIVKKETCSTEPGRGNNEVTADIAMLIKKVITSAGITSAEIGYAGIATPGAVNCDTGVIERACNLLMENYHITEELSKLIDIKTCIENDANAAALGEAVAGAAKGARYSVMVTLGTGVGGGIVMDGHIYSGFNFAGAEFGHMVIEYNGKQCNCGRRGCWEAYSSATALIEMTKQAMEANPKSLLHKIAAEYGKVSGKTAFNAKRLGDEAGAAVVDKYIKYLACGIINIINLFQPNILCIGGGISNEGAGLIDPLLVEISKESFTKNSAHQTEIRIAQLANDAGIIGAANLGNR